MLLTATSVPTAAETRARAAAVSATALSATAAVEVWTLVADTVAVAISDCIGAAGRTGRTARERDDGRQGDPRERRRSNVR